MRVLRQTIWPEYQMPPMTTVVRDSDVIDTLESIAYGAKVDQPTCFFTQEIFDMPDGTIEEATFEAMRRFEQRLQVEHNMHIMYFWAVKHFKNLHTGGLYTQTLPSPFSAADMEYVFDQLQRDPSYRAFTMIGPAADGTMVTHKP